MKIHNTYECEVCGKTSTDREEIEKCEARGMPSFDHLPPIGTKFRVETVHISGRKPDMSVHTAIHHSVNEHHEVCVWAVGSKGSELIVFPDPKSPDFNEWSRRWVPVAE
jgi:hypothetical protein